MPNGKLTVRMERFVLEYIRLGSATQAALLAGYSQKTASEMGYENLNKPQIKARIDTLQGQIASEKVLSVVQRKIHLSDTVRTPAEGPPTHRDHISAIGELNKMEKVYETGAVVNQDNRVVNIYVQTERAKELLGQVKDRWQEVGE